MRMSRLTRHLVTTLALNFQKKRAQAKRGRQSETRPSETRPDEAGSVRAARDCRLTQSDNFLRSRPNSVKLGKQQP